MKWENTDEVEEEGNTWMTPICEYLAKEILPEDKKKARAVRRKAVRILLANNAYGCTELDKECNELSTTPPHSNNPQQNLTPIHVLYGHIKSGWIDILDLSRSPGIVKYYCLLIEYFTYMDRIKLSQPSPWQSS
ncbi:hypothetical protein Tco_0451497 [Tanacetum coccineum]